MYLKFRLKSWRIEELLQKGYQESAHIGLYGGRKQVYLLTPRYNESAEHYFVVKIIEKFIKKYTKKVKLYVSVHPDIIFEWAGRKIAIEVETGKKLRRYNPWLENKKDNLFNYYFNWFFVVTSWKKKRTYLLYGPTFVRTQVVKVLKEKVFDVGSNLPD